MKHGIDELKKALKFFIDLGEAVEKRLDDGKISWTEGVTLLPKFAPLPRLISNFSELKAQWNDLDNQEIEELKGYAKDELDLENDRVERIIEDGLDLLTNMSAFAKSVGGGGPGDDPTDPPGDGG